MDREKLIKIIIIELFIVFFIKFQIFDETEINFEKLFGIRKGKGENNNENNLLGEGSGQINDGNKDFQYEKNTEKEKAQDEKPGVNHDVYQIVEKGKEFMKDIKPYVNKKEQYYIDIFSKMAEVIESHRQLIEYQNQDVHGLAEDKVDQIGILRAIKPYLKDDKQIIIDKFIKLHEGIQNINEKMEKFEKAGNKKRDMGSMIDRLLDIFEAIKPIIPDDKQDMAEKIVKNIKLVEALNKAEGIMNSMKDNNKKESDNNDTTEKGKVLSLPNKIDNIKRSGNDNSENDNKEDASRDNNIEKNIDNELKDDDINDSNEKSNDKVDKNTETDLENKLTPQQSSIINNLKSMLTKEQQQFMYNMINSLQQQSENNSNKDDVEKSESDTKEDKNESDKNTGN